MINERRQNNVRESFIEMRYGWRVNVGVALDGISSAGSEAAMPKKAAAVNTMVRPKF